VNRLKTKYGFPPSASAAYLGKINNLDSTRFYADLTASTLRGLGINVNFAPDVDLAINPDNPIIAGKERSYSIDPAVVSKHAESVIKAHQRLGIVTSPKHFPGHGSSTNDTHLGMADVTQVWQEIELEPYRILIENKILDAIMTAHIVNRNLDSAGYPATLSKSIVGKILRNQFHFDGVIFSDDMHMRAISDHYGLKNALSLSINAGLDVLLFSNNITEAKNSESEKVHRYIRELVEEGKISEERIKESYHRILILKNKYLHLNYE
jgi:beta-N-acetylhexosaminidase